MKVFLIRHGSTEYNEKGLMQGDLDIPLSNLGIKQAQKVKEQINKKNIDLIIVSPIKRAFQTAEIVNQDKKLKIIKDDRLKERCLGKLTGKSYDKNYDRNLYWDLEKNYSDENEVEKVLDLINRTKEFLNDIKKKYKNKTILIVAHDANIKAIFKIQNKDLELKRIKNCELMEIEL